MQKEDKNINKDPFLKVIKEKLENYSVEPDDSVWETIESRLDAKKKFNFVPWVSTVAAVACVVLLLWLTIPFNNQIKEHYHENEQLSANEPPAIQDIPEKADTEPVGYAIQEDCVVASVEKEQRESSGRLASGAGDKIVPSDPDPMQKQETTDKKERLTQEEAERLLYAMTEHDREPLPKISTKKKKASFGLSIGSTNNYVADNNNPLLSDGNWGLRAEGNALQKSASKDIIDDIYTYKDFEDVTHNAPLSFGLSFRYNLSERFALETGLAYTYLSTSFKNKSPKRDASLRLHYLGIPINAVVNIYETGKWKFYASAGGMIEKGIYSYYSQKEYDDDNNIKKTVSPDKDIDGVQLSVHAAPGVEFRFDKNYSVYLEPKVGYYFKNDQPVSVRTEHPFNIGVNAGIRFTL